jgi:hypothetical protein
VQRLLRIDPAHFTEITSGERDIVTAFARATLRDRLAGEQ